MKAVGMVTCARAKQRLDAFVDGELRGSELLMVSRHVGTCAPCQADMADVRGIGESLRGAAMARVVPVEALAGLADGVVSRVRAEESQAWPAKLARALDDCHWLLVGMGSLSAALLSVLLVCAMVQVGIPERGDSLAALISLANSPIGSDENPVYFDDAGRPQMLPSPQDLERINAVVASAVLDREGRVTSWHVVSPAEPVEALEIGSSIRDMRFRPLRHLDSLLSMRVVWLVMDRTAARRGAIE